MRGLTEAGCDAMDIGQCGTEMVYFGTVHLKADGGIMITASHNPKEYNGMKFVGKGAYPISGSNGLEKIVASDEVADHERSAELKSGNLQPEGRVQKIDIMDAYVQHLLGYVDASVLKPLKIVVNSGNGSAGPIIDRRKKNLT